MRSLPVVQLRCPRVCLELGQGVERQDPLPGGGNWPRCLVGPEDQGKEERDAGGSRLAQWRGAGPVPALVPDELFIRA